MRRDLDAMMTPHLQALKLAGRRSELLAANIANADTPHFLARDIDFKKVLAAQVGSGPMRTSDARHFGSAQSASGTPMFRVPTQPAADGNTVDTQQEKSAFMANAISYQSQIGFINSITRKLLSAIKGQ